MQQVVHYLKKNWDNIPVIISAQLYLKKMYSTYGLEEVGLPYEEDGIPHIKMKGMLKA